MKKNGVMVAILVCIAMVLTVVGCATKPLIEYQVIDWDGAASGKKQSEWPSEIKNLGISALDDYPGIKEIVGNKKWFLTEGKNKNEKLAREEARNTLAFQIAQELNTNAISTFNEVIDEIEQAQETINASASKARFTGFERAAETWVYRLEIDHTANDKTTKEYVYYDLFVVDPDVFEQQVNKYLSDIIGQVVKSENLQRANELRDGLVHELMSDDTALYRY
ncbi:MAG: hypothetical protein K5751_10380 [Treponemataceae bacterium]|nr:hypothetical protein [Treponemataceae bacterium]